MAVAGVSNHSNNLYYYLNTGGGTFGPMAGGNFPYVNFNPGRTLMADFDGSGDGQLDIVIVNSSKEPAITFGGQPSDTTAPVITPTVNGMQSGGWYTSDVTVSWTVDDPESAETSSGCDTQTVTTDTSETTFTCSATSLGGSNSVSVTGPPNRTFTVGQVDVAPNTVLRIPFPEDVSGQVFTQLNAVLAANVAALNPQAQCSGSGRSRRRSSSESYPSNRRPNR